MPISTRTKSDNAWTTRAVSCLAMAAAVSHFSPAAAKCEVEWTGLPQSYTYEDRAPNYRFTFDECCVNVRSQAAADAQRAWNAERERFVEAISSQTDISGSYDGAVSGSVSQSDGRTTVYDVDYANRRWQGTADCDCIEDGFISVDNGCKPAFGRKLNDNYCSWPSGGRKKDKCSIKVECKFRAVTPSSCPADV
jgi:hypothetical protein